MDSQGMDSHGMDSQETDPRGMGMQGMDAKGAVSCVTIVAESVVESRLLDGLAASGARGWTITPARGMGPKHQGMSEIEGGSIRVEVLTSAVVAERIWQLLREDYFTNYSIAAWEYPVRVYRAERYSDPV